MTTPDHSDSEDIDPMKMKDAVMTDRASAEGLPQTQAGTFLRNGLEAMGYDEQSANDAIVAIEREAAALRSDSNSGTHGHDVPGVGYLWWDASGKIIGGPEDD